MKLTHFLFLLFFALAACTSTSDENNETATTIYMNGKIFTVNESQPWAEALALKDDRLIKVGSMGVVEALKGEETIVIDLKGKTVLPGFIDAHNHMLNEADDLANLKFTEPDDVEAMMSQLKAYYEANPEIEVIRGAAWNLGVFPDDNPSKKLLDEIVPDKPVYLLSQSGHSAWVNSKTLELGGIDKNTPITGSFIYSKDPVTGEPSGRIDEYAMGHIEKVLTPTASDRLGPGLEIVQKLHNQYGVTTIKLAEGRQNWVEGAVAYDKAGKLTIRLMANWDWGSHYSPQNAEEAEVLAQNWEQYSSKMVDARGVKVFYDGALDSKTAKLLEPYEGTTDDYGKSHRSKEEFHEAIERINANGIGVVMHVMGDSSAREAVDIFEAVRKKNGNNGAILHLSHAISAKAVDLERMADIEGVAVDFSPALAVRVPQLETLFKNPIGEERYSQFFNVKAAIDAGVPVGFGSDYPSSVIPEPNTFWYLETWVTRKLPGDPEAETLNGDQAITVEQAIRAYTLGSAQCMGFDWPDKVGSLEEGKYADFVVLDRNIFEIPVSEIHQVQVDQTYVGGKRVFDRNDALEMLDIVDIEITNADLNNAMDAADLNLLVEDELMSGHSCLGLEHDIMPGTRSAPDDVNQAFQELEEKGLRFVRPARSVYWENTDSVYWIQWTSDGTVATLWAFDPDVGEVIEVLQVREKHSAPNAE